MSRFTVNRVQKLTIDHEDGWSFDLRTDEEGDVEVRYYGQDGEKELINIPKDCIPHFIDALRDLM